MIVDNQSGQLLEVLEVLVDRQEFRFLNVPNGAQRSASFFVTHDEDHFAVSGRLADGTPLEGHYGYVDHGSENERAYFIIEPEGRISFRQEFR